MATIGVKTLSKATDLIGGLLKSHRREIDDAYLKADDALSISLSLKIAPDDNGGFALDAGMNFVADRVKDTAKGYVSEHQMLLWDATRNPILFRRFEL